MGISKVLTPYLIALFVILKKATNLKIITKIPLRLGSIVERLCSDLDRKEPRYKSPTLLYSTLLYFTLDSHRTGSA